MKEKIKITYYVIMLDLDISTDDIILYWNKSFIKALIFYFKSIRKYPKNHIMLQYSPSYKR